MKNNLIYVLVLALSIMACTAPQQDKSLSSEDKENIEKNLLAIVDSIKTSANELRTDYFKKVYWNNESFIGVDLNGPKGYDAYMNETDEMYSNMKSIDFSEEEVSIVVFDDKTAVVLFEGNAKGENKNGVKMNLNNFNASMVFRKVDGSWKVAYTHESADQEIIMPKVDSTEVDL